jgi:hypothetical protein
MSDIVNRIHARVEDRNDKRISLLRDIRTVQWVFGDTSFLPEVEGKNKEEIRKKNKANEDDWGKSMMKLRRPDLALNGQWTNKFGEHLCEEMYILLGKECSKPKIIEGDNPDNEIDVSMIESKVLTYFTSGTAGEKILGVAHKYRKVLKNYKKPITVVCIGRAETLGREKYGILPSPALTELDQEFLDFYKKKGTTFIGATDLLKQLIA